MVIGRGSNIVPPRAVACPIWVKSCYATKSEARLLYPRKRTRQSPAGAAAKGQNRTHAPKKNRVEESKAAIPNRALFNLISYNYTTYSNSYEQMEWGLLPHRGNMMDVPWERSPLKHVANVRTLVMLIHGENDSDVPITEAEQFYIALKDVGVEAVMVRYPREGHGLREPQHIVDGIDRSIQWYKKHFP
jgi:acetyl esterase/lipase